MIGVLPLKLSLSTKFMEYSKSCVDISTNLHRSRQHLKKPLTLLVHKKQTLSHKFCHVVVVQLLSHVWLFATPWTAAGLASLSFTISRSLLKLVSNESVSVI